MAHQNPASPPDRPNSVVAGGTLAPLKDHPMAEPTITHLTPQELADRWHLAKNTLEHWRVRGDAPPFIRFGKRRVLYPLAEIERFERDHLMATVHIPCRAHPASSVLPASLLPAQGSDI